MRVADASAPFTSIDGLPVIVLGEERMRSDGLHRGDHIVLTSARVEAGEVASTTAEPLHTEFAIGGAYRSAHGGFDGNNTFVSIDVLRRLLRPGRADALQELAVKLRPGADADAAARRLKGVVNLALGLPETQPGLPFVRSWHERNGGILASVEH